MEAREERNNTEKFKDCGPQAHVKARNSAAWGWAAPNTPGLEKRSGTESGK